MDVELSYREKANSSVRDLLMEFECQPILFVGSGLSLRYFGAPNWRNLLKAIFDAIPLNGSGFEYYRQKFNDNLIQVGEALSGLVFEWAWSTGRGEFPEEFYKSGVDRDIFLKFKIVEYLKSITPPSAASVTSFSDELAALAEIKPHAIITTNYDLFLELVFDGYAPITGQTILRYNTNSFGEIFHIHGDVSDAKSIIVTQSDYNEWAEKKKYVSAKLLTYFAEHPVFILGYGLGDPNVKSIMRDIGELVADENGLIPNVYQIFWQSGSVGKNPPDQAVFAVDGKEYRTRAIYTSELKWVFDALKSRSALSSINPKLVRALAARMMKLIRHDIPSGSVSVNYDVLERVANEQDHLSTLLGITAIKNPNESHPFVMTQVATRLGLSNWNAVNKLVLRIKAEKNVDLKASDNRYHCNIRTGIKSQTHKWSHESLDLLRKVMNCEDYEIAAE